MTRIVRAFVPALVAVFAVCLVAGQAQSISTRHIHEAILQGKAAPVGRLAANGHADRLYRRGRHLRRRQGHGGNRARDGLRSGLAFACHVYL